MWFSWWRYRAVGYVVYLEGCGWKPECDFRSLAPASDGWAAEFTVLTVFARELWVIDSPYDWEVENRVLYRPLK